MGIIEIQITVKIIMMLLICYGLWNIIKWVD